MSGAAVERRAAQVSLVTGLSTLLSIVFQLVSVPVCLHFWGKERYGAWLAVFTAAAIFRTVDGGFIDFVGNRLNLLYHVDVSAMRRVLASSVVGVTILGAVQLGVIALAIGFGGLGWLFGNSDAAEVATTPLALGVLVSVWVISGSFLGILHRLLIPAGLMYQAAWWSMGYQASLFAGVIVAAAARLDVLGASILMASIQACVYVASAFYIRYRLPAFFPWWKRPDWRIGIADLGGSSIFMLSGALQQAATNGIVLLVTATFGAAALPTFTTVRTMVNLWTNVTTTLTSPLLPDVVRYHATRQIGSLVALLEAHSWLLGTLVNLGIVVGYPFMAMAYRYWTGGALTLDAQLMAALLASVIFANAGALMVVYLAGINDARAVLALATTRAVLALGIAALAVRLGVGVAGVGLGLLLAEMACFSLTAFKLFPSAARRVDPVARLPRFGWAWVSAGCAMLYLSAAAFGVYPHATLVVCVLGILASSWLGWRQLDAEVRRRLVALGSRIVGARSGT